MSATLELSDELRWMPAGWVYDNVLERLALVLRTEQPLISQSLLQARTEENGGYLDLRSARTEELIVLRRAAEETYARLESEGASSFSTPEYYEGFVAQFLALRGMLRDRLQELSPGD